MNWDKQTKLASNSNHLIFGQSDKKSTNRPVMDSSNTKGILFIYAMTVLFFAIAFTAIIKGYVMLGFVVLFYSFIFFIWKCINLDLPQNSTSNGSVRYVSGTQWKKNNNHYSPTERSDREVQSLTKARLNNCYQPKSRTMTTSNKVTSKSTIATAVVVGSSFNNNVVFSDNVKSVSDDSFDSNFCSQKVAFPDSESVPFDDNHHAEINPANGLPMVGGMGGVDIVGNVYGTDHDSLTATMDLFDDSTSFIDDSMTGMDDSFSSMDDSWSSSDDW